MRRLPIFIRRPIILPVLSLGIGLSGIAAACSGNSTAPAAPTWDAALSGANERPNPVTTTGSGSAVIVKTGTGFTYTVNFAGLTGAPTAAHIHGPGTTSQAVGVLVGFPATSATSGSGTLTGSFSASDIAPTRNVSIDSLEVLLRNGNAYVNVHTAAFGGGEIRGQLVLR